MSDAWSAWLLLLPLMSAAVAWLLWALGRSETRSSPLGTAALAAMCAGLLAELALAAWLDAVGPLRGVDLDLRMPPLVRLGLLAANGSLLCALFFAWHFAENRVLGAFLWVVGGTSSLLAATLLVEERTTVSLLLLGPALLVAAGVLSYSHSQDADDDSRRVELAKRVAGGLKHLALATIGTGLLVAGAVLLGRYGYSLENRGLLQLGVGLLAIGLAVRVGTMPFAPSVADLVEAAPGIAMVLLGAITPAALIAGLMLLHPEGTRITEGSIAPSASSPVWLGALGVLLAGIRALGAAREHRLSGLSSAAHQAKGGLSALIASTVLLQVGWALAGVLSGSQTGATGAALLSLNIALAAPLVILAVSAGHWSRLGLAVGVASLLGLPPLGGFVGTLFVAQAVLGGGGWWLSLLLLGSALVAVAWLSVGSSQRALGHEHQHQQQGPEALLRVPVLLAITLVAAQLALFALAWGITNYELQITN